MKNKVALITGAGSGIGLATALAFAKAGATLVLADIIDLQEPINKISALGNKAIGIRCNVAHEKDIENMFRQIESNFGRLDYAFNNAGIEQPIKALADITADEFDRLMNIDLRGVFLCMKYQIPLLLKNGGGAIVNTASGAGVKGFQGQAGYSAMKHGVIGLTKSSALDYAAQNIRINVIAPGIIDTPMMDRFTEGTAEGRKRVISQEPIGRMGKPEEIAAAVLWLCSDAASFVTGHTMIVDGGQTV